MCDMIWRSYLSFPDCKLSATKPKIKFIQYV